MYIGIYIYLNVRKFESSRRCLEKEKEKELEKEKEKEKEEKLATHVHSLVHGGWRLFYHLHSN